MFVHKSWHLLLVCFGLKMIKHSTGCGICTQALEVKGSSKKPAQCEHHRCNCSGFPLVKTSSFPREKWIRTGKTFATQTPSRDHETVYLGSQVPGDTTTPRTSRVDT